MPMTGRRSASSDDEGTASQLLGAPPLSIGSASSGDCSGDDSGNQGCRWYPRARVLAVPRAGEGETLSVVVEVRVTGVGEARSEGVVHLLPATAGPDGKRLS
jgi:hypothetical protein